jgi:ubiquinone/menaquinone biosynthesis C-methylase UbiE
VTWLLRKRDYRVTTLDFDPNLHPDICGDVTKSPCEDNAFDCVLAAEVLEHLPFEEFPAAIAELRRVSRKNVVITLPAPLVGISALVNLPGLQPIPLAIGVPYWRRNQYKGGEHYWEMGKRGYSKRKIRHILQEQGLRIVRSFRPGPSLSCHFFVAEVCK